jgi:hypothetical protein
MAESGMTSKEKWHCECESVDFPTDGNGVIQLRSCSKLRNRTEASQTEGSGDETSSSGFRLPEKAAKLVVVREMPNGRQNCTCVKCSEWQCKKLIDAFHFCQLFGSIAICPITLMQAVPTVAFGKSGAGLRMSERRFRWFFVSRTIYLSSGPTCRTM